MAFFLMFNLSLPCYSLSSLLLVLYPVGVENNLFPFITERVFYLVKTISASPLCLPFPTLNNPALLSAPRAGDFLSPRADLSVLAGLSPGASYPLVPSPAQGGGQGRARARCSDGEQDREKELLPVGHAALLYTCVELLFSCHFLEAGCCWPLFTCNRLQPLGIWFLVSDPILNL